MLYMASTVTGLKATIGSLSAGTALLWQGQDVGGAYLIKRAMMAFCTCSLFSASSKMTE